MKWQIPQFKNQTLSCSAASSNSFSVVSFLCPPTFLKGRLDSVPLSPYHPRTLPSPLKPAFHPHHLTLPSSKATNGFPSPHPDGLLSAPSLPGCETSDSAAHPFFPVLSRAGRGFQLQIVHFLECVRSGYGHSPKFSLLICKMGLVKYVICVWHTTELPSDPLLVSLSFRTDSAAKLIFLEWMSLHHSPRG